MRRTQKSPIFYASTAANEGILTPESNQTIPHNNLEPNCSVSISLLNALENQLQGDNSSRVMKPLFTFLIAALFLIGCTDQHSHDHDHGHGEGEHHHAEGDSNGHDKDSDTKPVEETGQAK